MPENGSGLSAADSPDPELTVAELDRARTELARYPQDNWYAYACGALRYVAEEFVTGRANRFTVSAARHALALAAVANGSADERPAVA